jgi:hypothetical protein
MKRSLLIAFVAVLAASQALAFGGSVGVFTSVTATSCTIIPPASGSFQPVVVHTGSDGTTGSQFQALVPACAGFVHLVDISLVNIILGDTQQGASAAYGSCKSGIIPVANMFVSVVFPPAGCCNWTVTRHPGFPEPTVISGTCSGGGEVAGGGTAFVKTAAEPCNCLVDNQDSTWGAVKELFRGDGI